MAFTFVPEDGTGLANSNSFVTVEFADEYLDVDIHEQTWPGLEIAVKQKLLAMATREICQKFVFKGIRTVSDSALPLPATGLYHQDGTPVEVDEIPRNVQIATVEFARALAKGPSRDPIATQGLKRIEVDVIQLEFEPGAQINAFPAIVQRLLRPYGTTSGDKPTFAKIRRS